MKIPSRFISFFKVFIERIATFILGCLAMMMVLYYARKSNPVINIAQVQSAMEIVDQIGQQLCEQLSEQISEQISQLVWCLASEVPRLNIHVYL